MSPPPSQHLSHSSCLVIEGNDSLAQKRKSKNIYHPRSGTFNPKVLMEGRLAKGKKNLS